MPPCCCFDVSEKETDFLSMAKEIYKKSLKDIEDEAQDEAVPPLQR